MPGRVTPMCEVMSPWTTSLKARRYLFSSLYPIADILTRLAQSNSIHRSAKFHNKTTERCPASYTTCRGGDRHSTLQLPGLKQCRYRCFILSFQEYPDDLFLYFVDIYYSRCQKRSGWASIVQHQCIENRYLHWLEVMSRCHLKL